MTTNTTTSTGITELDTWIREVSFRVAYSDASKGFIGKKALRDVVCGSIPENLAATGLTREQVKSRLKAMLGHGLTTELLKECDVRRLAGGVVESDAGGDKGGPSPVLDKGKQRAVDPVEQERAMPSSVGEAGHVSAPPVPPPPPPPPLPPAGAHVGINLGSLVTRLPVVGVGESASGGYEKAQDSAAAAASAGEFPLESTSTTTIPRYFFHFRIFFPRFVLFGLRLRFHTDTCSDGFWAVKSARRVERKRTWGKKC
jgi:hypothetical protein